MIEIQQAIEKLPKRDKRALAAWLSSDEDIVMPEEEEAALLASLDKAAQQLDAGQGVAIDEVRRMAPLRNNAVMLFCAFETHQR